MLDARLWRSDHNRLGPNFGGGALHASQTHFIGMNRAAGVSRHPGQVNAQSAAGGNSGLETGPS